jgi:hypothetical protein
MLCIVGDTKLTPVGHYHADNPFCRDFGWTFAASASTRAFNKSVREYTQSITSERQRQKEEEEQKADRRKKQNTSKSKAKWLDSWFTTFDWLQKVCPNTTSPPPHCLQSCNVLCHQSPCGEKAICSVCSLNRLPDKRSCVFGQTGSTSIDNSSFTRHQKSVIHLESLDLERSSAILRENLISGEDGRKAVTQCARSLYWLAKEHIAQVSACVCS